MATVGSTPTAGSFARIIWEVCRQGVQVEAEAKNKVIGLRHRRRYNQ